VDGAEAGQNALIVKAISVDESIKPLITFNKNVGKNVALKSLLVETGIQNKQKVFTNIDVPADKNYGFNGKIAVANGISFITLNDQIFRTTDMPLNTSQTFSAGSTGKVLFETGLRDDNTPPYGANSSFNPNIQVNNDYNLPNNTPSSNVTNSSGVNYLQSSAFDRDLKAYFETLQINLPYLADVTIGSIETVELKKKCDPLKDRECAEKI
jgi:hypothetical protein